MTQLQHVHFHIPPGYELVMNGALLAIRPERVVTEAARSGLSFDPTKSVAQKPVGTVSAPQRKRLVRRVRQQRVGRKRT